MDGYWTIPPMVAAPVITPDVADCLRVLEQRMRVCIVCNGPKMWLDVPTCSEECEVVLDGWPEP